jgi:parallel beta-helix repeat protein
MTIVVSGRSQLLSALAEADGGETITLKDGHYGSLKITQDFASTVTLRAEDPFDAKMSGLIVSGASNLRIDGIDFESGTNGGKGGKIVSIEASSRNITIVNSEVSGKVDSVYVGHNGIQVSNSSFVSITNNDVHDISNGIVVFGSNNVIVSGNEINYYANDALKFAGVRTVNIEDNISYGRVFPEKGAHNDFIQFQGASSDVEITGNVFLPVYAASQGIWMGNASYHDITIEQNIIMTGMLRGISIPEGSDITVRNNTLLNTPEKMHTATKILVASGSVVENNITTTKKGGGWYGSNLELQNSNPNGDFYVEGFFKNGAEGLGMSIEDLTPAPGSLATRMGAAERLAELLDGESTPAPKPPVTTAPKADPEPTPGPAPEPTLPSDDADHFRFNAGGPAAMGFAKDAHFTGGTPRTTNSDVAQTDTDAIYQSERLGVSKFSFDLEDGTYDVALKFAELHHGAAKKRVFDVWAEKKLVIDNLDIFKAAGGANAAYDRAFEVTVKDGSLDLWFNHLRDMATVSGIEISPSDGLL